MRVQFTSRSAGPPQLLCEAAVVFDDDDGPFAGLELVGFSLWRGADTDTFVTFPSRTLGVGVDRRYFNYLRGDKAAVARFKAFLIEAFNAQTAAQAPDVPGEPQRERRPARMPRASGRASQTTVAARRP